MKYTLRIPPDTKGEIARFVTGCSADMSIQRAIWLQIVAALETVEANPSAGTPSLGGPFESRRLFQFVVANNEVSRIVRIAYKIHEGDRVIVVSGFTAIDS